MTAKVTSDLCIARFGRRCTDLIYCDLKIESDTARHSLLDDFLELTRLHIFTLLFFLLNWPFYLLSICKCGVSYGSAWNQLLYMPGLLLQLQKLASPGLVSQVPQWTWHLHVDLWHGSPADHGWMKLLHFPHELPPCYSFQVKGPNTQLMANAKITKHNTW